jgi:hypothetical protein
MIKACIKGKEQAILCLSHEMGRSREGEAAALIEP